ncbi:hypothetical protein ABIC03_007803 [Bradyrhizobium sp. RT6a]|uniref:hypothetical protein n=1 Tax=Bradyrhizobium sp. RT6a TaxID=3156381 RepID=UPI003399A719
MSLGDDFHHVWLVLVLNLAITTVALLLQSEYGNERSERSIRIGGIVRAASLAYVKPENWKLTFSALIFSFVVAVAAGIVFDFGFGRAVPADPASQLAAQIAQAQLFVLVPAYLASLFRIYVAAVRGALSARALFEATTDIVFACLVAVAVWLLWTILGGLAPVPPEIQPYGLALSFMIGCCPSLALIQRWVARRNATNLLLPLSGLDQIHFARLYEAGVRNMQNLAYADPGALFTVTGLQLAWIIDWVAQAQLRVLISDESGKAHGLNELRQLGISNILDLARLLDSPQVQERMRDALKLTAVYTQDRNEEQLRSAKGRAAGRNHMRNLIEGSPAFRVLRNYADVVEKPPTSIDEVAQKIDQAVHGAAIINYNGNFVLALADLRPSQGIGCRGELKFSTKSDRSRKYEAPIQISDGENKPDRGARIPFDVRVNFRPPVIPGQSFRIDVPVDGDSSTEQFEVTNAEGKSIGVLIKIFQANRLVQTMSAKFPDEE